ncbi:MAG: IS701 family transposase [Micromonosporaceae bacterium]|nr:IS701 family transposase [Micromonosporaceae bacterium]
MSRAQRRGFRDYLVGLLRPRDRNKTLTCLANVEPGPGAQYREMQRFHQFLSDSPWDHERINTRRIGILIGDPEFTPHPMGALLLDDSGDRKAGHATAHVSRQYIGSRGGVENGIVAVSTTWADDRVYYPLHVVPCTPACRLPLGRVDPAFATKGQLAASLITKARDLGIVFRAVVADSFYGPSESPSLAKALIDTGVPFVLALKPRQEMTVAAGEPTTPAEAARLRAWEGPDRPGQWQRVIRTYRDGHTETWWATDVPIGPYRIYGPLRLVVVSTDPATLPGTSTWYLATNLAHPDLPGAAESPFPPATYAEITFLYGLRGWIEQDYKQVKHELGWADFQVRSDHAIRRHWTLVNCAFSLCWHDDDHVHPPTTDDGDGDGDDMDDGRGVTLEPDASPQPRPPRSLPASLRRVRSCLAPAHYLERIWHAWTTAQMPSELVKLMDALMAGHRLCLYVPP